MFRTSRYSSDVFGFIRVHLISILILEVIMKNLFLGVNKSRVLCDFILSVVLSILNCAFTHVMSLTVDYFVSDVFIQFIIIVLGVQLVFAISTLLQSWHETMTGCIIENGIYKYYMNKLYNVKSSVLKKSNTGYLAGLLNKMSVRQSHAYQYVVCAMPVDLAYITYFAFVLYRFDWRMSVAVISVSAFGAVLRSIVKRFISHIGRKVTDAEGRRTKLFTDVVSNIETVQKMSVIDFINDKADDVNGECIKGWSRWSIWDECSAAVSKFITFGFGPVCLIIMYFMDRDYLSSNLSSVAMIIAVATQVPHNAKSFARTVSECSKFRDVAVKLEEVVKDENLRADECTEKFESASISDVKYRYIDEERDLDIEVNIPDFRVNRGDRICITGESGQGKTTLLNILSGCIESESVMINDKAGSSRLNCVFISQDVEVFDMSLRDNLCLGNPDVSEEEMEYLIRAVGMYEWFESIGKDWETPLGERGVFVSTGQRQRLNLCRGLLSKGKDVYLLDEPTSNVDEETEKLIVSLLNEYLYGKTVVIVTHRPLLRTICDYKYRFSNGVLGERMEVKNEDSK